MVIENQNADDRLCVHYDNGEEHRYQQRSLFKIHPIVGPVTVPDK